MRKHGNYLCDLCQIVFTSVTLEENVCFACKRLDRSKNVRFDGSEHLAPSVLMVQNVWCRSFRSFGTFGIFSFDYFKDFRECSLLHCAYLNACHGK